MAGRYKFELMAIQKEDQSISSARAMLYLLSANKYICDGKEVVNAEQDEVRLSNGTVVRIDSITDSTSPLNDCYSGVFHVKVSGNFENVEIIRIPFIKYLLQNKFTVFVVNDEISQEMTKELYPLINKVETALRNYLIKYFIKIYSTEFWEKIADKDMDIKLENTEKNLAALKDKLGIQKSEKLSKSNLKLNMYGIEFSQLGRIIYAPRLGSVSSLDDAIRHIKEAKQLEKLQSEIFCFGDKFFKQSFIERDFQQKWEELTKIRHLVAHNNICLKEDSEKGKRLASEIVDIIDSAITEMDNSQTPYYKEISKSGIDEQGVIASEEGKNTIMFMNEPYEIISPDELLRELAVSENYSKEHDGYVGLRWFVSTILYEKKNYAIGPSYTIVNQLAEEGKIDIFDYMDAKKGYSIKAIRTL